MKNWNTIIRDAGRVVVCFGIVGAWLYCVVTNNPGKTEILIYGFPIVLTILGLEGVLKWLDGKGNGRYIKGEHD